MSAGRATGCGLSRGVGACAALVAAEKDAGCGLKEILAAAGASVQGAAPKGSAAAGTHRWLVSAAGGQAIFRALEFRALRFKVQIIFTKAYNTNTKWQLRNLCDPTPYPRADIGERRAEGGRGFLAQGEGRQGLSGHEPHSFRHRHHDAAS